MFSTTVVLAASHIIRKAQGDLQWEILLSGLINSGCTSFLCHTSSGQTATSPKLGSLFFVYTFTELPWYFLCEYESGTADHQQRWSSKHYPANKQTRAVVHYCWQVYFWGALFKDDYSKKRGSDYSSEQPLRGKSNDDNYAQWLTHFIPRR